MEIPIKPIDQLLERVLCMNILSSDYFKELYRFKTYHEVVDEIYNQVNHVEPWMAGNCRGLSTAFCLLYKFFAMKLTMKQMHGLLKHPDSPYIRAVVHDSSSMGLSSQEENSATKGLKSPAESSPAMLRAREVQSSLGTERPRCIKSILTSNVSRSLWMNLPQPFCNLHLPKEETMMVLEDQNGGKYDVTYTAYKSRISEGWKKFAAEHNLLKGDVLVFHLEALIEQMTPGRP